MKFVAGPSAHKINTMVENARMGSTKEGRLPARCLLTISDARLLDQFGDDVVAVGDHATSSSTGGSSCQRETVSAVPERRGGGTQTST